MTSRWRTPVTVALLTGLALLGNVFHIPLSFGIDFLSGNIFVFLLLMLQGTVAGVMAAAVAGSYTYVLWGHPYAWIGMVVQALLVGLLLNQFRVTARRGHLALWVASYWLVLGLFLIGALYHYLLGLGWQGAWMVAFKQAVNDVFNALVAALALHFLPLRQWFGRVTESSESRLSHVQSNLLTAFAFFPALIVITLIGRAEVAHIENELQTRLKARSSILQARLVDWMETRMYSVGALAGQAQKTGKLVDAELLRELSFYTAAAPDVAATHVINADGLVVLSTELTFGHQGVNLGDRPWFQRLRESAGKTLMTLVPRGRMLQEPLVVFAAPVYKASASGPVFHGGVLLTYRARSFARMFASDAMEDDMRMSLVSPTGEVAVSSQAAYRPGENFEQERGGRIAAQGANHYRWQPSKVKSVIQAWSSSFYGREVMLGDSGWRVVVELPLAPHFPILQEKILNGFGVIFVLALFAIVFGAWLGRWIVQPLERLSLLTGRLAQDIVQSDAEQLPRQGIREIDALVENFETMSSQLRQNYRELMSMRDDLESRVEERTMALARARDDAEAASRAKTDFLSSMSHELRTPMNAILGFSQLLEMEELSPEQRQSVHEIHTAGKHLLALINDLLDLSKIEAGNIELSIETVEVGAVLEECATLISPLLERYGVRLVNDLIGRGAQVILADRVRFKQVLLNLLSNAIKYNHAGGTVTVSCSSSPDNLLRVSVADTGAGLTPQQRSQLFTPFNRLGAEKSSTEGTGIGLVITRRLTEMMAGRIGVDSTPGQGSTFWVEMLRSERSESASSALITQPSSLLVDLDKKHKVLYIEDNPANLRLVALALSRKPTIHLQTAHDPQFGLELAEANRPDLILLDINLPGMSGYEVLKRIRSNPSISGTPVVAVSAKVLPDDLQRGRDAGFDDYLAKPVDIEQLLDTVDRLLA